MNSNRTQSLELLKGRVNDLIKDISNVDRDYKFKPEDMQRLKAATDEILCVIDSAKSLERTVSEPVDHILQRLKMIHRGEVEPYLTDVCNHYLAQKISEDELIDALRIIESFLFRRLICELPTSTYEGFFSTLHENIIELNGSYVDGLKTLLLNGKTKLRFPTDNDFLDKLEKEPIASWKSKDKKIYLFARLEDGDNQKSDVWDKLIGGEYVIDRIMPANLNKDWKSCLGPNPEDVHMKWRNRLANLTIISADAELGNRSFVEKKVMSGGFDKSPLRLNKFLAKCSKWSVQKFRERNKELKARALEIWAYPSLTIQQSNKELESSIEKNNNYTLNSDFDFTGRKIYGFSFLGDRYAVEMWKDMLVKVLKIIYAFEADKVHRFADRHRGMFSKRAINGYEQIDENLYINVSNNTISKIKLLQNLFKACGLNGEDLEFELKPLN